jgi:predicted AAA+ superfamily ATPase
LAHYHGQVWNASELARAFGIAHTTVGRYLDLLTSTFVVRRLAPWHENISKRQVRSPKIYFADTGLLHTQLQVDTMHQLQRHPKVGASWEGFALDGVIARLGARPEECFFWSTHGGAELDLLVVRGRTRRAFEFKRSEAPAVTKAMRVAAEDLGLKHVDVVHAGRRTFPLARSIRAVAIRDIEKEIKPLA